MSERTAPLDLFVIGGGINGAAIACDAAGRGLAVGLAEMQDFAEGTSSRSSKLIHGGLRYLETYDFKLVRDALLEREILMHKAPHLVRPLRLVLPHVPGLRPRAVIRAGLLLYDHLAWRRRLPASQGLRLDRHPLGAALKPEFRHGYAYSDCTGNDARLVIATLQGAAHHGARILPRHRCLGAERRDGLWLVRLRDERSGVERLIEARALVNAAGPWVLSVAGVIPGARTTRRLRLVKGSHLVVRRWWRGDHGYFLQTRDRRLMEVFPYEADFTSIGTTDESWDAAPEQVAIADHEIDYMLAEINRFLRTPVQRTDVLWSYAGVRPLFEVGAARDGDLSTLTRDYSFEIDAPAGTAPLLTVFGGKLTTHRRLGEEAVARLARWLGPLKASRTVREVLPGGDFEASDLGRFETALAAEYPWLPAGLRRHYAGTYGTQARTLLGDAGSLEALGPAFGAGLHAREVDHLIDHEWALAAEDIVWRRTKFGLRMTAAEFDRLRVYVAARTATRP